MRRRMLLAVLLSVAFGMALSGCPPLGASVAGAWQLNADDGCDASVDLQPGIVLDSDGSARLYVDTIVIGVWTVTDSIVTITFTGSTFSGVVSSNGSTITNGTYTGGCWTARRVEL